MSRSENDRGQATPLLAGVAGLAVVVLLAMMPMARALVGRAQARTAADAAALAGAAEGRASAEAVAESNEAELVAFDQSGDEVVVKVSVDGVTAFARAGRREPEVAATGATTGSGDRAGLAPAMLAALVRADGLLGHAVPVVSGYRSPEQQRSLWERRASNPYPVARPGSSMHERGLAIDVPRSAVDDVLKIAHSAGLCQPLPQSDPVHFEVCGAR